MTSEWDEIFTCPVCKSNECVPAWGKENSKILLIGEFPGKDEVKTGRPFSGATGKILKNELSRLGIDLSQLRLVNLWPHMPNHNDECLEYGKGLVAKEAKGKKAILLVGSDVVKTYCDMKVSEVSGLVVHSDLLSAPLIMAMVQPATVFHGTIGEVKLALQKFAGRIGELL